MCLILIAHHRTRNRSLIVAANRDEYHARPTAIASFWKDAPDVFAGRDLEANGTWLGVSRSGRFAAVANWTDNYSKAGSTLSRGSLPRNFLESDERALEFVARINDAQFQGYNLVVFDGETLVYTSNRAGEARILSPGIHGISNCDFSSPCRRVDAGKADLESIFRTASGSELITMLERGRTVPRHDVPSSKVGGIPSEALLFLNGKDYGTRACTAVILGNEEIQFHEQSFGPSGDRKQCVRVSFPIQRVSARPFNN